MAQTRQAKLAVDGGVALRSSPFAPWPSFSPAELQAVENVLRSGRVNYWTGDQGRNFEHEFSEFAGTRHAVACANGTVALELALYALGVGNGDEVIVPGRSFFATASCVLMRGARPVFADVDRDSQNLTAAGIVPHITGKTRAIIAVHLAGWPCDMDAIGKVAQSRGLRVIEDCAQAHAAADKGRRVGSMGDVGAFSFCQDKIMTTGGEGGILTTNNEEVWKRAWSFKDHGKNYGGVQDRTNPASFRWVHDHVGTNWRLTEMQAALGRVALGELEDRVRRRRELAGILAARLTRLPQLRIPIPPPQSYHAYYKFYAFLRPETLREGWDRDRVLAAITEEGIPCFVGSCSEIYLEKAIPEELRPEAPCAVSRELGATSLMFLVHHTLCEQDMLDTCEAIEKVLRVASQ